MDLDMQRSLEDLVDKHGLRAVLEQLATVCHDKADHVATNWQDDHLARTWSRAGIAVNSCAARKAVVEIATYEGRR